MVRLLATDSEFAIRRSDATNYAIYRRRYAVGPGFESLKVHQKVSAYVTEGPPVPIPNTEVKLCRAEDTWLATARENRTVLT